MRRVEVEPALLARLEAEARAAYPNEACGFLFSGRDDVDRPTREIVSVEPAPNEADAEPRRRFVISPAGLQAAEARGADRGAVVSGFYHSHPDHPARPSQFDTEHAWPWYVYLVTSVDAAGRCTTGAFELDPDRLVFEPRELVAASPAGAAPRPARAIGGA